MAIGPSTFTSLSGAVSDLFAADAATTNADLKARGLQIEAEGTDISAQSLLLKSQGDLAEASEYDLAGTLATQNAQFTEASTRIQASQQDRAVTMTIGGQRAAVGASGLAESGSSLDLLREFRSARRAGEIGDGEPRPDHGSRLRGTGQELRCDVGGRARHGGGRGQHFGRGGEHRDPAAAVGDRHRSRRQTSGDRGLHQRGTSRCGGCRQHLSAGASTYPGQRVYSAGSYWG